MNDWMTRHMIALFTAFVLSFVLVPIPSKRQVPGSGPKGSPKGTAVPAVSEASVKNANEELRDAYLRVLNNSQVVAAEDPSARVLIEQFAALVRPQGFVIDPGTGKHVDAVADGIPFRSYNADNLGICERAAISFTDGKGFVFLPDVPWTDWFLGALAVEAMRHWASHGYGMGSGLADERDKDAEADGTISAIDRHSNGRFLAAVRKMAERTDEAKQGSHETLITIEEFRRLVSEAWPAGQVSEEEQCVREIYTASALSREITSTKKDEDLIFDLLSAMILSAHE